MSMPVQKPVTPPANVKQGTFERPNPHLGIQTVHGNRRIAFPVRISFFPDFACRFKQVLGGVEGGGESVFDVRDLAHEIVSMFSSTEDRRQTDLTSAIGMREESEKSKREPRKIRMFRKR